MKTVTVTGLSRLVDSKIIDFLQKKTTLDM